MQGQTDINYNFIWRLKFLRSFVVPTHKCLSTFLCLENAITLYQSTPCNIPPDTNLQHHCYNNLTTHIDICPNTSIFYVFILYNYVFRPISDYSRVHNWSLKYRVSQNYVNTDLKDRIRTVVSSVPREMCVRALNGTVARWLLCVKHDGEQVETVL